MRFQKMKIVVTQLYEYDLQPFKARLSITDTTAPVRDYSFKATQA